MSSGGPLPVVLVGAGTRARGFYARLLRGALADRFDLVGLVSRSEGRARELAGELDIPWSLALEDAKGWGARGAVVAVSPDQNHDVALQLVSLGMPALLETPLALELEEAQGVLSAIEESDLPFEVAEQNPRHLGPMLWSRIVHEGLLGELRCVSSDGEGYRYHATAVARSLFGRRSGQAAVGMRSLTGIDLDRGVPREPIYGGTISVKGGGFFQLRASEVFYAEQAGWAPGGWSIFGDQGSIHQGAELRLAGPDGPRVDSIAWDLEGDRVRGIHLQGSPGIRVESALPDAQADDDLQAVGRCLLDWLERLEGSPSPTGWSARDALTDLTWIHGLERSAILGGARVSLQEP